MLEGIAVSCLFICLSKHRKTAVQYIDQKRYELELRPFGVCPLLEKRNGFVFFGKNRLARSREVESAFNDLLLIRDH